MKLPMMIPSRLFLAEIRPISVFIPGHLACCHRDAAVNVGQRFALQNEAVLDGICLAEHAVGRVVATVDPPSLIQHVLGLGSFGVACAVRVDVVPNVREQVGPVAGICECRPETVKVAPMFR